MTAYRNNFSDALTRIEERRQVLKIPHETLYQTAAIARATYWRMRRDGLAFKRQVQALHFAIRTIAQKREAEARYFDGATA